MMFRFTAEQLVEATGGRLLSTPGSRAAGDELPTFSLGTDSRTLSSGQCFVPLSGPNFDGHDFLQAVLERPATGVMGQADKLDSLPHGLTRDRLVLAVADPLTAYGDAASWRRERLHIPVVGLTGTAGKTSTKDLIRGILAETGPGLATEGNLNNLIGLPSMVLRITDEHRWAVLEMGMNAFGEIERMAQICRPTVRLITNVGSAHTEGVGGIDGVARAKGELFATARPGDRIVVNADDARIVMLPLPSGVSRVTYGTGKDAQVRLVDVQQQSDGTSRITVEVHRPDRQEQFEAPVPLLGRHNAFNATAAAAVAVALNLPTDAIVAGLSRGKLSPMRMERVTLPNGVLAINDAYNANPSSMEAALDALVSLSKPGTGGTGGRALAVLGDMLELGTLETPAHQTLGAQVASRPISHLFLCGPRAVHIAEGARTAGLSSERIFHSLSHDAVAQAVFEHLHPGDVLLLKGSRGARMEKVLQGLQSRLGQVPTAAGHG